MLISSGLRSSTLALPGGTNGGGVLVILALLPRAVVAYNPPSRKRARDGPLGSTRPAVDHPSTGARRSDHPPDRMPRGAQPQ